MHCKIIISIIILLIGIAPIYAIVDLDPLLDAPTEENRQKVLQNYTAASSDLTVGVVGD